MRPGVRRCGAKRSAVVFFFLLSKNQHVVLTCPPSQKQSDLSDQAVVTSLSAAEFQTNSNYSANDHFIPFLFSLILFSHICMLAAILTVSQVKSLQLFNNVWGFLFVLSLPLEVLTAC